MTHMKRARSIIALLCALTGVVLVFAGCTRTTEQSADLFALDTYIQLTAHGAQAEAALAACEAEIYRLEELFSVTRPTSDISRVNTAGGAPVAVSEETAALLAQARTLSERTNGTFDPTVYPLMRLWGFGASPAVPDAAAIAALLPLVDARSIALDGTTVSLPMGAGIDFGGIAKGYISDRLADVLRGNGIESALLTLGGNVHALGLRPDGTPWRIGVRDPKDESAVVGVVAAHDCAVITSGGYQRYFEVGGTVYHHILDPKTGYPAESGLASVTIIAGSGTVADALSTALFVMGEDAAIAYWRENGGFAFVLVTAQGEVLYSENAPFTVSDGYGCRKILTPSGTLTQ